MARLKMIGASTELPETRPGVVVDHAVQAEDLVAVGLRDTPLLVRRAAFANEPWKVGTTPPQPDQRPFSVRIWPGSSLHWRRTRSKAAHWKRHLPPMRRPKAIIVVSKATPIVLRAP